MKFSYTFINVSVRCRLVLFSVDISPVDVANFDGDNDIEDTVRLIRFLFDCSNDDDEEEEDEDDDD
jgi:hypothetical protein